MKLSVKESPVNDAKKLDGFNRIIIETEERLPQAKYFQLTNGEKICGAILHQVRSGKNEIIIDKYLKSFLDVRSGDPIELETPLPVRAIVITLGVPPDWNDPDLKYKLINRPVSTGQKIPIPLISGGVAIIQVLTIGLESPQPVIIDSDTEFKLEISREVAEDVITWADIGGLEMEIRKVREVVELPIRYPEIFERLGIRQPRGIILCGPPRCGKTLIGKALANEVGAKFFTISGPEIFSRYYGDAEERLRTIFTQAQESAPSIIMIDELDSLVPPRDRTYGEQENRIVSTFLTLMDGLNELKGVVVIATTNRINAIDAALRTPGRFEYEINIGTPDQKGRQEILEIHTKQMPLAKDVKLDSLAEKTHGFVGGDLAALCRAAAFTTLRRTIPWEELEKGQVNLNQILEITQADFEASLSSVAPSALREFSVEVPQVKWDDIGGLEGIKQLLIENIIYAMTKKEAFLKAGIKPAKGILLYGIPGGGKTLIAKAIANECGANFISVKGPEIRSKWFGESEERIRGIFARAREVAPCVIFFDEIDAAAPERGRDVSGTGDPIVNQLLTEMDGIEQVEGVFVLGATNRVELLDRALLRPGRFDYQIEVPLPNDADRAKIFQIHLKNKPLDEKINLSQLVNLAKDFSGAEIAEACRQAALAAMREVGFEADRIIINMTHLKLAIEEVRLTQQKIKSKPIGFATSSPTEEN